MLDFLPVSLLYVVKSVITIPLCQLVVGKGGLVSGETEPGKVHLVSVETSVLVENTVHG